MGRQLHARSGKPFARVPAKGRPYAIGPHETLTLRRARPLSKPLCPRPRDLLPRPSVLPSTLATDPFSTRPRCPARPRPRARTSSRSVAPPYNPLSLSFSLPLAPFPPGWTLLRRTLLIQLLRLRKWTIGDSRRAASVDVAARRL